MMMLDIALSDWGVASWTTKHLTEMIQPVLLRAPEVLLEAPWGPAVDIWNLGAPIPEFLYAQRMFSGRNKARMHSPAVHLEEMTKLMDPIPRSLVEMTTVHGICLVRMGLLRVWSWKDSQGWRRGLRGWGARR